MHNGNDCLLVLHAPSPKPGIGSSRPGVPVNGAHGRHEQGALEMDILVLWNLWCANPLSGGVVDGGYPRIGG